MYVRFIEVYISSILSHLKLFMGCRLSLSEKVKLFSNPKEKLSDGDKSARVGMSAPRRRQRAHTSRFNTQVSFFANVAHKMMCVHTYFSQGEIKTMYCEDTQNRIMDVRPKKFIYPGMKIV